MVICMFDNEQNKYVDLESKVYIKYLGVLIDKNLSWKHHIDAIATKISKNVGLIAKLRYYVPRKILLNFYKSLIQPYLRTFAPIATAHLYCAHHSLSTHVPRHFQAHALSRKLNKNIEPVTLALTWCTNIFVGCSVTPNFFSADHFLFRFSPLY